MKEINQFNKQCFNEIKKQGLDDVFRKLTKDWIVKSTKHKYTYHFQWLGRPIIQHPQDILGMQELIFNIKPDLIIETGIAHGGSLIFYSSILELNTYFGGPKKAKIIGIDIDIRKHNLKEINNNPMKKRIILLQGSSTAKKIYNKVIKLSDKFRKILVILDSNHTHEHVLNELKLYAPLVSVGSYCVVFDTIIKDLPDRIGPERNWNSKNNPHTALIEYLKLVNKKNCKTKFKIDNTIDNKLMITACPSGFLLRV